MIVSESKLKELLKKKGITKSALCEKVGISSRTIAKISKGEEINDNVVMKILTYLDASFDDVIEVNHILETLEKERMFKISGGLYHETQVRLTYNSNHIEGSKLTEDQTRYIFETNTILFESDTVTKVDDILETSNHFKLVDYMLDVADKKLTEKMIKEFHKILKDGTSDSRVEWFNVGEYKQRANTIGSGIKTTSPNNVEKEMSKLMDWYNSLEQVTAKEIIDFHYRFESIHPFQDGNGRIGRIIIFKECLKNNIVPFIIQDADKLFYYRGLKEYKSEKGYLTDTCLNAQDQYIKMIEYYLK